MLGRDAEGILQKVQLSRLDLRCVAIDRWHLREMVIQRTGEEDLMETGMVRELLGQVDVDVQRWSLRLGWGRGGSLMWQGYQTTCIRTLGTEREIGIPEQDRNPFDRAGKQKVRQRNS